MSLYLPSYLRLNITLLTDCVIYRLMITPAAGCSYVKDCIIAKSLIEFHVSTQADPLRHTLTQFLRFLRFADVATVEARCAPLREARGGLPPGCRAQPPADGRSDGPQHFVAPRSPSAEPRPAHLSHDSRCAGRVRLLCVDRAHPHLPPGNRFQTAKGDR